MRSVAEEVVVTTGQGAVRGVRSGGVAAFKGIPYAEPPFGERRLLAPERHAGWDGVLDGTRFGPTAPRTGYPAPFERLFDEPVIPGDDCLSVNVWTPGPDAGGRPVMVWIHGGAFRNGTSASELYDGAAFARDGVVLVSLNYRLGADGFLLLEDAPANRGLLDQVAALEWVQEHIAAFGGDPGNVTIFGESAGGISVCSLIAMPRAHGLFRRAIAQSGGGHHALPVDDAARVTAAVAERLGVPATRAGIASAELGRLIAVQAKLSAEIAAAPNPARWGRLALDIMPFEPTVDGDVLPGLPIDVISRGDGADVPLLVGATAEEWRLFMVPTGLIDHIREPLVSAILSGYGAPDPAVAGVYAGLGGTPGDRFCAVATDWYVRMPAVRLAEARSGASAPAHMFEWTWRSPAYGGRLGACHALELPFLFDTLDSPSGREFAGEAPPRGLAGDLRSAWTSFARSGDPGWPAYDTTRRAVMAFGDAPEVVADLHGARRAAWDGLR